MPPPLHHAEPPTHDAAPDRPDLLGLRESLDTITARLSEIQTRLDAPPVPEPLWTVKDVAARLNISERHTETLIATGELPPPVRLGTLRRWHPDTIEAAVRRLATDTGRTTPHRRAA